MLTYPYQSRIDPRQRQVNGAMEESSWMVQKASTHVGCLIVMDVAVVEGHIAILNVDATSLQRISKHFSGAMEPGGQRSSGGVARTYCKPSAASSDTS